MSEPLGSLPTVTSTANTTFVVITDGTTSEKIAISDLQKIIRPFAVYSAKINQSGVSDPVSTIQENTFSGDIVWTRTSQGVYNGFLTGAFPIADKFWANSGALVPVATTHVWSILRIDNDNIQIRSVISGLSDDVLVNACIEVRQYY